MISAILVLVSIAVSVVGGLGYLQMKGKLASTEASFKSHIAAAVRELEASGSKIEADAKADVKFVAAYLKSKL